MRKEICAYIAGFLDGDGSIIFQIVRRKDYRLGFQIRASVCFYQKSTSRAILLWLKNRLREGYIRERGIMSDYTIVGVAAVKRILNAVGPYVVAKRRQALSGLRIIRRLTTASTARDLIQIARLVDGFSRLNYSKRRTVTADQVHAHLYQTKGSK